LPTKNVYFTDEEYQEASFIASRFKRELNEVLKEAFDEGLKKLREKYLKANT